MRGDEVDGARGAAVEDVGRASEAGGEVARAPVAAPEAAHVVAKAVVPFEPGVGELAKAIAAGADVPRLGDHDSA